MQAEAQALFADELAPSAAGPPVGVVGVIDESAFTKNGSHSAGVARQHNGRFGKEDNCRVGVFLLGVTPAGSALLDHQLFLPESRCEPTRKAKDRRDQAQIPEDVSFGTEPRIAADLVRNIAVLGQVEKPTVPSRDGAHTVAEVAAGLPASAWKALRVREGAIGPLVFEFAAARVWGIRHRQPGPSS